MTQEANEPRGDDRQSLETAGIEPTSADAACRATGYAYQSKDFVDKYSSEALVLMDQLWQDVRGFHDAPYFLPENGLLPAWLMEAVRGIPNRGIEAGWPQFARYWDPVDWPALVAAHPEEITWDRPEFGAMYTELWDWGIQENMAPGLDVALFISSQAKIEVAVWSFSLGGHEEPRSPSLEQTQGVDKIFASHAYTDVWRFPERAAQWELE